MQTTGDCGTRDGGDMETATDGAETTQAPAGPRMVVGRLGRRLGSSGPGGGVTPSQLSVLGAVARHGPMRLSELADHEGVNPTMLSRIVGKLCDEGLILRRTDDRDRRAFH